MLPFSNMCCSHIASNAHVQLAAVEYLNISVLVIDVATSPVRTGNSFFEFRRADQWQKLYGDNLNNQSFLTKRTARTVCGNLRTWCYMRVTSRPITGRVPIQFAFYQFAISQFANYRSLSLTAFKSPYSLSTMESPELIEIRCRINCNKDFCHNQD